MERNHTFVRGIDLIITGNLWNAPGFTDSPDPKTEYTSKSFYARLVTSLLPVTICKYPYLVKTPTGRIGWVEYDQIAIKPGEYT